MIHMSGHGRFDSELLTVNYSRWITRSELLAVNYTRWVTRGELLTYLATEIDFL